MKWWKRFLAARHDATEAVATAAINAAKPLEKNATYLIYIKRTSLPQAVCDALGHALIRRGIHVLIIRGHAEPPSIYRLVKPEEPL